jgi:hypothetical protein
MRTRSCQNSAALGVGPTDFVGLLMGKLAFNCVRMPFAAFVQQHRCRRSQSVNRQFGFVIAEPAQGRIECIVADRTMP